jgi:hypothetical protein
MGNIIIMLDLSVMFLLLWSLENKIDKNHKEVLDKIDRLLNK